MSRFALLVCRLCVTAWVGTATFFVVVVLELRRSQLFSDRIKLEHPKVLFPLFYEFEFGLLGVALLAAFAVWKLSSTKERRSFLLPGLIGAALLIAVADWYWIYRPLTAMLESSTLPETFRAYHTASRWVNTAGLAISAAAACIALWPPKGDASM